jgi:hypothetical protein
MMGDVSSPSSVIPAQAGTHGKPKRVLFRKQNENVATVCVRSSKTSAGTHVGPGLRRDDGCGDVSAACRHHVAEGYVG